jgi:hypothetical protein
MGLSDRFGAAAAAGGGLAPPGSWAASASAALFFLGRVGEPAPQANISNGFLAQLYLMPAPDRPIRAPEL